MATRDGRVSRGSTGRLNLAVHSGVNAINKDIPSFSSPFAASSTADAASVFAFIAAAVSPSMPVATNCPSRDKSMVTDPFAFPVDRSRTSCRDEKRKDGRNDHSTRVGFRG